MKPEEALSEQEELTGEDARILTETLRMANETCERLLVENGRLARQLTEAERETERIRHDRNLLSRAQADWEARATEAERENGRLREALEAVYEVAVVANDGDPWYCEHENVDVGSAFTLAQEALQEGE